MVGGDWGGRQLVAKQAGLRWVRASCPAAGIDLCLPRLWAAHGLMSGAKVERNCVH